MAEAVPDILTLRILTLVSDSGTIGRAAAAVGVTQQAASLRIRAAEHLLGRRLVDRSPSGSTLTAEGLLVVEWSRGLLAEADRLERSIRALRDDSAHGLTVSASQTISEHFMPDWMSEYRQDPQADPIRLTSGNSDFVIAQVRSGAADVGLIETPEVPSDLASAEIRADELVVVVSPDHAWAGRGEPLSARELTAVALITREAGSGTRRTLELALQQQHPGLALTEPSAVLSAGGAIRAAVANGMGVAVLSAASVREDVQRERLRVVPLADLVVTRPLTALWQRERRLPAGAERLFSILRPPSP